MYRMLNNVNRSYDMNMIAKALSLYGDITKP